MFYPDLHHHIPSLRKALCGSMEVRIGLHGLLHQLLQDRIAAQFPSIGEQIALRRFSSTKGLESCHETGTD